MSGRPLALVVVLTGVLSVLLAVATNVATDLLPDDWRPGQVLAWSVVGSLALATIVLGVWQSVVESRRAAVAGAGPELEGAQLRGGGGERGTRLVPAQLPPDIAEFTGRERELELLRGQLAGPAAGTAPAVVIAAIAGKPGVGKSALAIHLAHEVARHYPDGRLYVNLRGASRQRRDPVEALGRFLRALGVADDQIPVGLDEQVALYRSQLYGRRVLVVLDDAADAAQIRPLLPGSPGCAVLVTSRSPLTTLEGATVLVLELLEPEAAVELLGKLAGAARVEAEPEAAAAIARHCGYLPLALRIAGGKLAARPGWPLAAFEARLVDERRRLAELRAGDLEVRASFELSYEELGERDARTFRLLGLLESSDVTPQVAAALTEVALDDAEDALERLADAHLLESPVPGRYRFHDLLRLFARELASAEDPEGERHGALARVFGWYAEMAEWAVTAVFRPLYGDIGLIDPPSGSGPFTEPAAALAWLEAERANLVASVRQAGEPGTGLPAWRLALAVAPFFELRKYWPDWQSTGEWALQAAERAGDKLQEGFTLQNLGYALRDQRNYAQALPYFERSLEIFRALGTPAYEGRALTNLGTSYRDLERYEEALACYEESLSILRDTGGRLGEARVREGLGAVYRHQGRFEKARACFEQSIPVFAELGDRRREGRSLGQLGRTLAALGLIADAEDCFERGLACIRQSGDRYNEARSLLHMGRFQASQGRPRQAADCLGQAAEIFEMFGDRYHEGLARKLYGTALSDLGDHGEARDQWRTALDLLGPVDAAHAAELRGWLER